MKFINKIIFFLSLYILLNFNLTFSLSNKKSSKRNSAKTIDPSNPEENIETITPKKLSKKVSCDTSKNMFRLNLLKSDSSTNDSTNIFMPIFSTSSLTTPQPEIETASVFIHGNGQNANKYFCDGYEVMKKIPNTISLAPWFGNEEVDGAYWGNGQITDSSAWWKGGKWKDGGNTNDNFLSSFDVLDQIILALSDPINFPNMKLISFTGFSAGGQTLQKYSFFSSLKVNPKSEAIVRVIISNPGSYMYLDKTRPDVSCIPLKDTTKNHICTLFSVPIDKSECPKYNNYKYGLKKLSLLKKNYYVKDLTSEDIENLKTNLKSKDIRFIFGDKDICNSGNDSLFTGYQNDDLCKLSKMENPPEGKVCKDLNKKVNDVCDTFPDSFTNVFDKKCKAMMQGSNRLQRGRNYLSFLTQRLKFTPVNSIFDGGHDNVALYNDARFLKWVTDSEA